MVIGLLLRRRRKRVERRPRQIYVPLLEGKRVEINGRTYIVRNYAVAGDSIVLETVDGRIIRIPLHGEGDEGEGGGQ